MKKIFNVEIKEVRKNNFEIQANSSAEAEFLAEQGYYNGKYILDGFETGHREISFTDIENPRYISDERKEEIFSELIDYVSVHTVDEKDFYESLRHIIGLEDNEITELEIEVKRILEETSSLQESEINFEDDLIFENDEDNTTVNAYIPLYYIDIFEKFNIKNKQESEYDLFLTYDIKTKECKLSIIEKGEKNVCEI